MYPDLFHIGPIPIRSYGLLLAVSFLLGVLYIKKMVERDGKPFDPYLTVASYLIFFGVVGARLFYVLFHLDEFANNWGAIFNPFSASGYVGIAGLNLYGGVLFAVGSATLYCMSKKMNILDVFDYFAPTLGLGLGITRIGCFLNGCCFGVPTDLPWGISFPEGSIPYYVFGSQHLHPTQLYSSLYGILLFVLLHFILRHRRFVGQAVAILFMVEAVFRYVIENIRWYESEMTFNLGGSEITYNQVISLGLFLLGLAILLIQRKRGAFAAVPPKADVI
jgi:phosphatidylglycerol:prolipoprotein diacylglycerol transferase